MDILVVDIGGINVKLHAPDGESGQFATPPGMNPEQFMAELTGLAGGWQYDHVSVGFPGPVRRNRPLREPVNLGSGWADFDFQAAFGCPVRVVNDAALQALGGYRGGIMLFLGLGTGLGTTLIHDDHVVALEMAHLPFRDGDTFERQLGKRGLDRLGLDTWKDRVREAIELFSYVMCPEYVLLGGGNARLFGSGELPGHVSLGDNVDARAGGVRLWEGPGAGTGA